ncbi:Hypothetical_protein [Hexamita inflata]|uniref:Hypothetical_protein n=1 Tax=Hexamita inflata TaxID=28002 RepID=A0AA86QWN6_9EUKA|nr:Hypothetical protein HINF_LOCUS49807 [Hexamita inflata]
MAIIRRFHSLLRYNGTVYKQSMNLLSKYLPEIANSFLSKHGSLAVARAYKEAELHYTSLITNALHDETIALRVWEQGKKAMPKATLDPTGGLGLGVPGFAT